MLSLYNYTIDNVILMMLSKFIKILGRWWLENKLIDISNKHYNLIVIGNLYNGIFIIIFCTISL